MNTAMLATWILILNKRTAGLAGILRGLKRSSDSVLRGNGVPMAHFFAIFSRLNKMIVDHHWKNNKRGY